MASVSAIFGLSLTARVPLAAPAAQRVSLGVGMMIECSSRPQKKATKHHMKTRPRKTNPSDRRHGPAVYPPLPTLPSEWTLIPSTSDDTSSSVAASAPQSE